MTDLKNAPTEWNLSYLLNGDDDPNIEKYREEITKKTDAFANKWKNREDYLSVPAILKEALDEYEGLSTLPEMASESYYFGLRSAQDSMNTDVKAKQNKSSDFIKKLNQKLMYFYLSLSKIEPKYQPIMLESPLLKDYHHFLQLKFAAAKHKLTEAEENLMMLKSGPAYSKWVEMVDDSLSREEAKVLKEDGKITTVTLEEMLALTSSPNKDVRSSSGEALSGIFAKTSQIAEAEINAILENKKIDDEIRKYERPEQYRLLSDDIDAEVVEAMVESVSQRYELGQKFMDLKAKLLKVPKLEYYERAVGYGEVEKEYSYEDSLNLVDTVLADLDPEFSEILRSLSRKGLIDVYPKKGKQGGAFCAGVNKTLPTYIMLNHTNKLRDVTTIAHEVGHAINNELIKKKQNELNFGTPTSTAEVASTFMEDFVFDRLLAEASEEEELVLRVSQLQDQVATIFRQVAAYRFELELHSEYRKSGYVSKEKINELFCRHMKDYLGTHSDGAENWWVYWTHFRRFFYVYSYASGLLISKSLQGKVKHDRKFIKEVKEFLSAGKSKSPKEIFMDLGIDITDKAFWGEGLNEIEDQIDKTEKLAKKLGKI